MSVRSGNDGVRSPGEGQVRSDEVTRAVGVRSGVTGLTQSDRSGEVSQASGDKSNKSLN